MRQLTSRADDTFDFVPTVGDVAVRLRAVDWARSPLGPVDGWSSGLRAAVGLCLGWGAPACLAWGPGRVLFYNDTCAPLFGDLQPLALGRDFSDCALAADPAIADAMRRAYQGETVCLAEHPVPIGAGDRTEERLYSFAFTPIRDANGEVAGVFQALTDVTAQALEARAKARRAEGDAALREANRRLTVVLESVSDVFVALDHNWHIAGINDRALELTGRRREEVLGRKVRDVFPMYRGSEIGAALCAAMRERKPVRREIHGAMSARWFEISIYPSADGLSVFGRDIDERKRAEQRLRDSEERFAQFMQHLPGMAWLKDLEGQLVFVNDAAVKAWGLPRERLLGRTLEGAFPMDTDAQCRASDAAAARTSEGLQVLETYRNAAGEQRHVLVSKFSIPEPADRGPLIGGIAIDVTERRQAEEALRASEARLAAELRMMGRLHDLSARLLRAPDLRTGLQEVLDAALAVCGTDLGNVQLMDERSRSLEIVVQRGFGAEFLEHFRTVSTGDASACARSFETGERVVIEDTENDPGFAPHRAVAARAGFRAVQSTPMLSHDGRLLGILSTHFRGPHRPSESTLRVLDLCARCAADFIERFRIEQALRASEERLQLALRGANAGVWRFDVATGETFWSEEFGPLYGLDVSAPRSYEAWLSRVHPEDCERVKADFLARIKSRATEFQYELRVLHPQRGVRWILDLGRIERDAHGRAVVLSGINLDITERKQAEEALRRERELLQTIFDRIPVMITMYDPDARMLRVNRAFERVLGWSTGAVAGTSMMEACYPDPAYRAEVQAFMESCRDGWMDICMRARDGRDIHTSWANIRLSDRTQVGIGIDITERRRAEEAMRDSERLYRAIGESIDYGVWVCDPEGRNRYASESFLRLVGMTQEQCAEFGWAGVLHPDDAERTIGAWKECVRAGAQWDMEHRYRGADGQWHPILARGVPVRNARGEITAWAGINLDIGRLKQIEQELREADRRKDEFLATLAHELRNPLAPLRNGLEIMRLAGDNRQALEQARGMMERQLTHLVRLVDDLLDLSRITRGRIDLRRESVDLAVVVRHALETCRPVIEQAGHELSVRVPPEPVLVEADTIRLAQAIANLLNNAARYTDRGGHIRLAVTRRGSHAEVSVQDNGVGIPPAQLPHVFETFARVDRPLARGHGGLGIGLSIVKYLVEMHAGTVEAYSPGEGKGSEFRIRLPLPQDTYAPGHAAPAEVPGGAKRGARRVLVADDNADAVASLAALLELLGNDVRTASDGCEAVEIAAWFRPELALLDLGMPGLDGCGACQRIRAQPGAHAMTIVALTGWGQEEDKRRSQAAGFDQHLVKPVEPSVLERLLATLPR